MSSPKEMAAFDHRRDGFTTVSRFPSLSFTGWYRLDIGGQPMRRGRERPEVNWPAEPESFVIGPKDHDRPESFSDQKVRKPPAHRFELPIAAHRRWAEIVCTPLISGRLRAPLPEIFPGILENSPDLLLQSGHTRVNVRIVSRVTRCMHAAGRPKALEPIPIDKRA